MSTKTFNNKAVEYIKVQIDLSAFPPIKLYIRVKQNIAESEII